MSLYAISDLHLSLAGDGAEDKPMGIFGSDWVEHALKIKKNWTAQVQETDTVIIAGDISWAMRLPDAAADFAFLRALPGRKVLVRGNHDYWWGSIKAVRAAYPEMVFLQHDFTAYGEYAICGTRGWLCPNDRQFTAHDEKIYLRELGRLEHSLESARRAGYRRFVCALHYPPFNNKKEASGFMELIARYGAEYVVYGHIHGRVNFDAGILETPGERQYLLTSCDYLNFNVKKIF